MTQIIDVAIIFKEVTFFEFSDTMSLDSIPVQSVGGADALLLWARR